MRVATTVTMSLAGLVAAIPWAARGSAFSDPRYRDRQQVQLAAARLNSWIAANSDAYQLAGEMRIMGYNSPFIIPNRRYFEVQIPVEPTRPAAVTSGAGDEFDLADVRWNNRVLIAFGPSEDEPPLAALLRAWRTHGDAVLERDLMLVRVLERGESRVGDNRLSSSQAGRLRDQFGVEPGDCVFVLIGKDGTVKSRRAQFQLPALLEVIDAMPMRRAELAREVQD